MKSIAAIMMISMFSMATQAQYTVKISLAGLPSAPATDAVYIAGSFNNWNPQDDKFRLQKQPDGVFTIIINQLPAATYEFKFTRGSWAKGETGKTGAGLPNRKLTLQTDTSLQFTIAGWKDGFLQVDKMSTASAQVKIIDTAFAIPQLGRTRRVWLYLPKNYGSSVKRYPVLYMHDGQNLFDNATAYAGEWGVDEALDSVANACIVVGIDNGGKLRMNEYNPNSTKQFGKGEGKAYLAFIVDVLKPYIDKQFRTLPGKAHTAMAGSSMGGLISFYAGLYYPRIFGALGIFSPSFWIVPDMKAQVKKLAKKTDHGSQKYYFYAGGEEGRAMVTDMDAVASLLKATAPAVTSVLSPAARHNETAWSAAFEAFYRWLPAQGIWQ